MFFRGSLFFFGALSGAFLIYGKNKYHIKQYINKTLRVPYWAYNRTKYIKQRHEMMQHWSDYLDGLQVDNVVVQVHV
jgi:hypothetical protein